MMIVGVNYGSRTVSCHGGAKQNMQAMQLRANNLANVSTTGFRSDLAQARSMQAYGEGMPTGVA